MRLAPQVPPRHSRGKAARMTGRELAHEPGSLTPLSSAYDAAAQPLLVFRFLSDPERKAPVIPSLPNMQRKTGYGDSL